MILINHEVYLIFDAFPNSFPSVLTEGEFMAEAFEIRLDTELIIGGGVTEVEARGDGEVCFEDKGKLRNDALASRTGVGDQKACF